MHLNSSLIYNQMYSVQRGDIYTVTNAFVQVSLAIVST